MPAEARALPGRSSSAHPNALPLWSAPRTWQRSFHGQQLSLSPVDEGGVSRTLWGKVPVFSECDLGVSRTCHGDTKSYSRAFLTQMRKTGGAGGLSPADPHRVSSADGQSPPLGSCPLLAATQFHQLNYSPGAPPSGPVLSKKSTPPPYSALLVGPPLLKAGPPRPFLL